MKQYRLTIRTDHFCMKQFTPLDGTIAGILLARSLFENPKTPISLPMFEMEKGVALASYPIFETRAIRSTSIVPNMERNIIMSRFLDAIDDSKDVKHNSLFGSASEVYSPGSTHIVHFPKNGYVDFYITGDPEAIEQAFQQNPAYGAWTGKGYGSLSPHRSGAYVHFEEITDDYDGLLGIVAPINGETKLARPIPLAMAEKLNIPRSDYVVMMGHSRNPYNPTIMRRFGYPEEEIAVPKFGIVHV